MSRFVDGFGSEASGFPLINLDLVAKLQSVRKDGKTLCFECLTVDGESLGRIGACYPLEPEYPVTPDTTGTVLVMFCRENDGSVTTARYPVIAWRHEDGIAMPLTPVELRCSNATWCLELTTGLWVFPEDCDCTSLAEATVHACKLLRKD